MWTDFPLKDKSRFSGTLHFLNMHCELWDNCGIGNSQKLEQLQLEAARIVKGLPIFTKTDFFNFNFFMI
jgi:hypothetical protein